MHHVDARDQERCTIRFSISGREITVGTSRRAAGVHDAELDAGPLRLWSPCTRGQTERAPAAFPLRLSALHDVLGCMVASTGLRYLVVPVAGGLDAAQIIHPNLSELLHEVDAEFAYLLDVEAREGRRLDNDGSLEDVATGSAAGVAGAFLVANGLAEGGAPVVLRHGRFVDSPSALHVTVGGRPDQPDDITIAGRVAIVARGTFEATAC